MLTMVRLKVPTRGVRPTPMPVPLTCDLYGINFSACNKCQLATGLQTSMTLQTGYAKPGLSDMHANQLHKLDSTNSTTHEHNTTLITLVALNTLNGGCSVGRVIYMIYQLASQGVHSVRKHFCEVLSKIFDRN